MRRKCSSVKKIIKKLSKDVKNKNFIGNNLISKKTKE
jgi:hypothetical protein